MSYLGNTDQGKQILKCVNYYERRVNTHLLYESEGCIISTKHERKGPIVCFKWRP